MPQPSGRRPPNSDELAKQIAERLAQSDAPKKTAFSFRDSVLVGRLMSATIVLLAAGTVVFAVVAGVNWFLDRVGNDTPSVLAAEVSGESTVDSTIGAEEDSAFQFATTSTTAFVFGPVTTTTVPVFGARITIPAPTTTTTTAPATSAPGASVTNPPTNPPTTRATTTSPPTTLPPTTSSSSSAPTTTTSTTEPPTSTTDPTTTTSTTFVITTTTMPDETTSTTTEP